MQTIPEGNPAIDAIDVRIIKRLQMDGSATNRDIARELKVSEATVRRRRARLEELKVIHLTGVVNPVRIGYQVSAIIGIQAVRRHVLKIEEVLKRFPEVHFLGLTSGTYDLMLEVWFRTPKDLVQFSTETLASIEGIIRTDVFQFLKLSKYYSWSGEALEAVD